MNSESKRLTIGWLAGAAGTAIETIRFYEREQLLHEPARTTDAA